MKRFISLLLSAALLLGVLAGCREPGRGREPSASWPAALDVVNAVFPFCGFDDGSGNVEYLTAEEGGEEFLSAYLENAYGLEDPWEDAAVIRGVGASAFEIAVLRMEDESAAVRAATALMSYIFERQGDFAGYAPAQADMVAKSSINRNGPFVAMFICPDTDLADRAFEAVVRGSALPSQPGVDAPKLEAEAGVILEFLMEQCKSEVEVLDSPEHLDSGDPDGLSDYIAVAYGLTREQWEDAAIFRGTGASAFELAVLKAADEDTAWSMMEKLTQYLDEREALFVGYAPDQFDLLYQAAAYSLTGSFGTFVVLPVCENARQVFNTLVLPLQADSGGQVGRHQSEEQPEFDPNYPDRIKFVQPNEDDMSLYDTSAILSAWESGDPSGLSDYDRDIYDAARAVLDEVLKDGMSDYEEEAAVYSWLVNHVDYDWRHQDVMAQTPRESYTPYGGVVERTAVCLGYATTFQLLMDLAGVECITVVGAAHFSEEDHAWNMVRLDGNWYCVDVTWDANYREQGFGWSASGPDDWNYFNITSDEMAETNHQWDYANTPEAVAGGNSG